MDKDETIILMAVLGLAVGLIGFTSINQTTALDLSKGSSAGDFEPPIVRINSPQNNDLEQGTFIVSITATDNYAMNKVALFVDGRLFAEDSSTPYDFLIKTYQWPNGLHFIQAKAFDRVGYSTETPIIRINVSNLG